jgi:membrane protease YdiL (CAAX protease family)
MARTDSRRGTTQDPPAGGAATPRLGAGAPRSGLVQAIDLAMFLLLLLGLWAAALAWAFPAVGDGPGWVLVRLVVWGLLPVGYARAAFGPGWATRVGLAGPAPWQLAIAAGIAGLALILQIGRISLLLEEPPRYMPTVAGDAVLAAALEELVFRGIVQARLTHILGGRQVPALLLQAALTLLLRLPAWTLLDAPPASFMLGILEIALAAGALRAWTRSLWPPMALHVASAIGSVL